MAAIRGERLTAAKAVIAAKLMLRLFVVFEAAAAVWR